MSSRSLALGSITATLIVMAVGPSAGTAWVAPSRETGRLLVQGNAPNRPLFTAIDDAPAAADVSGEALFIEHVKAAGARFFRIDVRWRFIAPEGTSKPAGFNARDPGDPRYAWDGLDRIVRAVATRGLTPLISVYTAPAWAESGVKERPNDGPFRPRATELADFFSALATRFSGSYGGLPRVRYWQIWNEPNLNIYLAPQLQNGAAVSPAWYRGMVNAAARAVHTANPNNIVIAGGLAPFGGNVNDPTGGVVQGQERVRPLQFMRQLLCMSAGVRPKRTCSARTELDVWAHHPYTYGGPTHSAFHPDDVSLGDLPRMRALLEAAERSGAIRSRGRVGFWVTEFSYDSKPADPKGLDPVLHARWTSEALYRMWQNGVGLVTWFRLRDDPFPQQMAQSGLYLRGQSGIASDKPKPALRAFRFPFVAFRNKDASFTYWGRTPTGTRKTVVVEQKQGSHWRRLVRPAVNRYGIFQGRIAGAKGFGPLRARLVDGSDVSLPFGLNVPKDFRFCPWGSFC